VPQVSVIISTYNREAMLTQALRSALAQRDVDHEVIVVDNGSSDGTAGLLADWSHPRLRVVRNETSLGSVGGRNTGLTASDSEWVGMLDDDDVWAPTKLREQIRAATESTRNWSYVGCVHIDGSGRILGGRPPQPPSVVMQELPIRFVLPGGMSNLIWRRDRLDGDGLLDPRLPFPADWDVSLRLSRQGPPAGVREPLVAYRQHGSNMSRDSARYSDELRTLEAKRADLAGGRPIDWGSHHRFVASEELRVGARMAAFQAYLKAIAAGDLASLPRSVGVFLPTVAQRWLLRTFLSDRRWIHEAEAWLSATDLS
jgi:glycosyltransferase involved in cell wall biosynthesis